MLETKFVTLKNGKKLRVAERGNGPTIVFLHGYPENLQIWTRLVIELAPDFHCIAIDWPGMGYSDEWPGGATAKHMAQHLYEIIDNLGIQQVSLIACDMGGQAALEFAHNYTNRTLGLIVMNSLVFGSLETSWEIKWLRKYNWNRHFLNHLPGLIFYRAFSTFLPPNQKVDSEIVTDFWNAFKRMPVRKFISKMCAGYQGSFAKLEAIYSLIKVPTLILWGAKDKHFPLIQGQTLHKEIKSSKFVVIENGHHWMNWSHAKILGDEITRFLSESRPPGH